MSKFNSKTLMMQLNNKKAWIVLGTALILAWLHAFTLALQVNENNIEKVENDPASVLAMSVAEDLDLNIINNISKAKAWSVTTTLNHPALTPEGSAATRLPFQLYGVMLNKFGLNADHCLAENYIAAQIFSNLFFFLLILILLNKLLLEFGFTKNIHFAIAVGVFGTPLIWNVVFEPTGVSLPLAAVLTLAFYLMWTARDDRRSWKWFLIGSIFCFAFTIKQDTFFYFLAPVLFCALQRYFKKIPYVLLGWASVFVIHLINEEIQWGRPLFTYFRYLFFTRHMIDENLELLKTLIGPNGALFISPILIFSIVALVKCVVDAVERKEKWDVKEKFILSLVVSLLVITFVNPLIIFEKFTLGSGQFLGQTPIIVLGLCLFFLYTDLKNIFLIKLIMLLCVMWNFGIMSSYLYNRSLFGLTYKLSFSIESLTSTIQSAIDTMPPILLATVILWSPLAGIIWLISQFIEKKRYSVATTLSLLCISLFVVVTGLNLTFNRSNTQELRGKFFFRDKVRGTRSAFYFFDQINKALDHVILTEKFNGNSSAVDVLMSQKRVLHSAAIKNIEYDPLGFQKKIEAGEIISTPIESKGRTIGRNKCQPE